MNKYSLITATPPRKMTTDSMKSDFEYRMAERLTSILLENNLISEEEYSKINALNIKSFHPFLAEIMT